MSLSGIKRRIKMMETASSIGNEQLLIFIDAQADTSSDAVDQIVEASLNERERQIGINKRTIVRFNFGTKEAAVVTGKYISSGN
jgi:hypothetical protein